MKPFAALAVAVAALFLSSTLCAGKGGESGGGAGATRGGGGSYHGGGSGGGRSFYGGGGGWSHGGGGGWSHGGGAGHYFSSEHGRFGGGGAYYFGHSGGHSGQIAGNRGFAVSGVHTADQNTVSYRVAPNTAGPLNIPASSQRNARLLSVSLLAASLPAVIPAHHPGPAPTAPNPVKRPPFQDPRRAAASAHPGWDRGFEHLWGDHHYRWYDNGWLMIDDTYWPPASAEIAYTPVPVESGPHIDTRLAGVQSKLRHLHYYQGRVDGIDSAEVRQAIENYQRDNGLPVTGTITDPLLLSLGLE